MLQSTIDPKKKNKQEKTTPINHKSPGDEFSVLHNMLAESEVITAPLVSLLLGMSSTRTCHHSQGEEGGLDQV